MNCVYCDKKIENPGSLKIHENGCKSNPNRKIRISNFKNYNEKIKNGEIKKNNTNQFIKAKNLGLLKPEVSIETRNKISDRGKKRVWSEENKKKHSIIMKEAVTKYPDSYTKNNVVGRVKNILYNGVKLKGSWEVLVAKWLDSKGIKWEHETRYFIYEWNGKRKYFPDFYLPELDFYIEVKGYQTDKDVAKWSVVSNLIVIKKTEINEIKKGTYIGSVS